jgi:hypothetical protein
MFNGTNFYTGARDAQGNSCFKLGTSSKIGSFKFEVPDDVTEVVIYAAKYKAKTSKITVNGKTYTLSGYIRHSPASYGPKARFNLLYENEGYLPQLTIIGKRCKNGTM